MAPYITLLPVLAALAGEASAFAPSGQGTSTSAAVSNSRTRCMPRPSAPTTKRRTTAPLRLSRDNDRARMEKSWEHMMGEDWREFRAKLVAQEHAEEELAGVGRNKNGKDSGESEGVGKVISAISSIFSKGEKKEEAPAVPAEATEADMFDGQVGGADALSQIPTACSDPFMDEEECHLIFDDEPEVKLDPHRWAHPLFHVEPGCILVANEKLGGVFHQTVVLIIEHSETQGSTGMVINRPFPGNLIKIASDQESNIDLSLKMAFGKAPVSYGGPVMQDQFSTLHGFGEVAGSKKVCPGVFVGGSSQLMNEVRRNNLRPEEVLFVKGHAAWVPGQLKREIEKGVWYIAAASADLVLRYAGAPVSKDDNPSDLWADVLSCMGDKFEDIAVAHSGRGDDRMLP
ncbi:hypothetical protein ACHAXT_008140 [Thalassiosira profunda]